MQILKKLFIQTGQRIATILQKQFDYLIEKSITLAIIYIFVADFFLLLFGFWVFPIIIYISIRNKEWKTLKKIAKKYATTSIVVFFFVVLTNIKFGFMFYWFKQLLAFIYEYIIIDDEIQFVNKKIDALFKKLKYLLVIGNDL